MNVIAAPGTPVVAATPALEDQPALAAQPEVCEIGIQSNIYSVEALLAAGVSFDLIQPAGVQGVPDVVESETQTDVAWRFESETQTDLHAACRRKHQDERFYMAPAAPAKGPPRLALNPPGGAAAWRHQRCSEVAHLRIPECTRATACTTRRQPQHPRQHHRRSRNPNRRPSGRLCGRFVFFLSRVRVAMAPRHRSCRSARATASATAGAATKQPGRCA